MVKISKKMNNSIALAVVCIMLLGAFLPFAQADVVDKVDGFDKGPSYTYVIPMEKVTFINFDKESLLDDYAYLAAIPTAVFNDGEKLISYPLLFYEDEYDVKEDKERSLNARQGLDYFMEDWIEYCNGQLDQMTLINVPEEKVEQWDSKEYIVIESDNPYSIASKIALQDWSYSDDAVVAVIDEEYERINELTGGITEGTLSAHKIKELTFDMSKPVIGTGGTYHSFDVLDENYKYIVAKMTWDERVDYDLQLYDDQLGMVQAAAGSYSDSFPYVELVGSYIHNYGKWETSISAVPKKGVSEDQGKMESMFYSPTVEETGLFSSQKSMKVDVTLYPGGEVDIMGSPFGCRDAEFTLKWNNPGVKLGFTLLDPVGTEIASSITMDELKSGEIENEKTKVTLNVELLGECREDENYSICVFALEDINQPVDYTIEYSWYQNFTKKEGDCLSGATNAAVLASTLNAPLLFTSDASLAEDTKDTLYKLGVENIYLVNIGSHLSKEVKDELKEIANVKKEYNKPKQLYDSIMEMTNEKDVIFSTIDPWSYWYVNERKEEGEYSGAYHIGPASYIAAHHGSPVLLVDIHPRLSQATVYHTDWWAKNAIMRFVEPSSGSMVLSSKLVYDFLEEYGFGRIEDGGANKQIPEIIITVAGQFDIGTPWDRSFTGAGLPGRFWGSPVDSAYVISRNIFYPALVFLNPGMGTVELEQGSSSTNKPVFGRFLNPKGVSLVVTEGGIQEFEYPILQTYNTYQYRFNEEASKHWDFYYTRADGVIPYVTDSPDPIDDGVAHGKTGAYYPDQSETEVIPFYADKAGFDSVFSTNFDKVVDNLNGGVLIWVINCHGMFTESGMISLWDPNNPYIYEENPWRAYEPILLNPGNIREFVRWVIYLLSGEQPTALTNGLLKFHLLPEIGSTENPDVAHINPQLIYLNKLRKALNLPIDFWGATGFMIYRDRLKNPIQTIQNGLPFINFRDGDGKVTISPLSGHQTMIWKTGLEFDDELGNLHSCGINAISCLPANTYLHMTWMRHGAAYQIIDPWTTTDWAAVWQQMVIKRIALGDTIGEAYERGMRACGPEYPVDQWWWDVWENVELFADPNLRVYVPENEYSTENTWKKEDTKALSYDSELSIDGHMPFGASAYPHEKQPKSFLEKYFLYVVMVIILIVLLLIAVNRRKKSKRK